jgi:hypothetical protein
MVVRIDIVYQLYSADKQWAPSVHQLHSVHAQESMGCAAHRQRHDQLRRRCNRARVCASVRALPLMHPDNVSLPAQHSRQFW